MESNLRIRLITEADAQAALEVYKPYVISTAITFEYGVPTLEDFSNRIRLVTAEYPWLVCEHKKRIIGYAYASKHRFKIGYRWSPESTIYMVSDFHRRGIARVLYETLFDLLKLQGFVNLFAGVALPNEKSEGFHRALGFFEIGNFKKIGYKLGRWHDVRWFQLHLADHIQDPPPPRKLAEVQYSPQFSAILQSANEKLKALPHSMEVI
jgi:L-amino acid N-acyltransferase YncA